MEKIGLTEESVGDAGREHPFNTGNAHVIGAFQVTGPFHKCARTANDGRWPRHQSCAHKLNSVSAPDRIATAASLALSQEITDSCCLRFPSAPLAGIRSANYKNDLGELNSASFNVLQ